MLVVRALLFFLCFVGAPRPVVGEIRLVNPVLISKARAHMAATWVKPHNMVLYTSVNERGEVSVCRFSFLSGLQKTGDKNCHALALVEPYEHIESMAWQNNQILFDKMAEDAASALIVCQYNPVNPKTCTGDRYPVTSESSGLAPAWFDVRGNIVVSDNLGRLELTGVNAEEQRVYVSNRVNAYGISGDAVWINYAYDGAAALIRKSKNTGKEEKVIPDRGLSMEIVSVSEQGELVLFQLSGVISKRKKYPRTRYAFSVPDKKVHELHAPGIRGPVTLLKLHPSGTHVIAEFYNDGFNHLVLFAVRK